MPLKDNVISLQYAKAVREAVQYLHSPQMRDIIYEGASGEFKRLISPVIRDLLSLKGAPEEFQQTIISLLEKIYATHHIDAEQTESMTHRIDEFLEKAT